MSIRDSAVMIELSDVITNLRTELETARLAGVGEGLRFELGPVELEVSVALAKEAGVDAPPARFAGYKECGCGMGPALNIASSLDAYALTDRGTWLSFKNRGGLAVLVEGDQRLFNQYGVIVVNPAKHPHTKTALAQAFADWVVSPAGQAAIAGYKVGGEQLFFPNASR